MLEGGDGLPLRIQAQRGALTLNLRGVATEISIEPKTPMVPYGLYWPQAMGVSKRTAPAPKRSFCLRAGAHHEDLDKE